MWVCGGCAVERAQPPQQCFALQKQLRELKEGRREMEEEANKLTREIHDLTERSGRVRAEVAEPTLVLPSLGQMWAG